MAPNYSVQKESKRLLNVLVNDPKLSISDEVKAASERVQFDGHSNPWLPVPLKFTESISAISALVSSVAAAVAQDRYGVQQDIKVNTDRASVFLFGFFLPNIDGTPVSQASEIVQKNVQEADKYDMFRNIHRAGTNQYRTKDGRYYHTHGSMNTGPLMRLLGIPEQDVTLDEAKQIYADKVAQWNAEDLDYAENEEYRQAGSICYTPEEFLATEHGKIASNQPIATITELEAPRKPWPSVSNVGYRPLAGIRVIDFARAVAAPAVSKVLAALGADVIKVSCSSLPDTGLTLVDINAGKRDVNIDLKTPEGKKAFSKLVRDADVLVDGFRPHALEKLGFHSKSLRDINPSLIYLRENCYGWDGPWAHRSGWQQIADSLVGLAILEGQWLGLDEPVQPLLPNSDYQTGVLGSALVVQALLKRTKANVTFDIDVSLAHYNLWLTRAGPYDAEQQKALRDLHPEFKPRHNWDLVEVALACMDSVNKARPGVLNNRDFFETISGKEWGETRNINVVGAPFKLSRSDTSFAVPSGRRGWSNANPEWLPIH